MRENRTYGSEGGEALPSRPLSVGNREIGQELLSSYESS